MDYYDHVSIVYYHLSCFGNSVLFTGKKIEARKQTFNGKAI